jgi:spore coat polysaccharide biosynthesis protein SpsF
VSNLHPPTHPDGNDVEIMTFEALETAWHEASAAFQREHTTPFLWDQPERFRIGNVEWETGDDFSRTHRLTLDYPEDHEFLAAVCDALYCRGTLVKLEEIVALLARRPGLLRINARHAGANWYWDHIEKLRTVPLHATRPPEFV